MRQASSTAEGLKAARRMALGPRAMNCTITAPVSAAALVAPRVSRQSSPARKACARCGAPEPSVSAPTSRPVSRPMSAFAQVAIIFMPTG